MVMQEADWAFDVSGLSKSFDGKLAVNHIKLQVKRGEIFGFLGPNGSGKTTTIRMLCGLLEPDAGEGHCLGYDIVKQSYLIKQNVGYMTQHFSLYQDLTIFENLDFIARVYQISNHEDKVQASIEHLGLQDRKNQLAGTLSGGWKQRVALAAALLHEPKLLLLDEPTAGVDPKARRDFWDQIHRLSARGITTLVSTHYMDEAERCHRLAYIAYGQLLTHGTFQQIIEHSKLITWAVEGGNLLKLSQALENLPGIEQVTAFGNTLHVSGRNRHLLEKSVSLFQNDPQYHWQSIKPGLEDVFISLSAQAEEQYHAR